MGCLESHYENYENYGNYGNYEDRLYIITPKSIHLPYDVAQLILKFCTNIREQITLDEFLIIDYPIKGSMLLPRGRNFHNFHNFHIVIRGTPYFIQ